MARGGLAHALKDYFVMAEFPALPIWTDAFMGDCGHLSDAETGRYFRMLMVMWRSPGCRIPNDDEWIARRFNKSQEEVQSEIRPLVREFCKTSKHFIWQGRLTKEMEWVRNRSKTNRDSAKARWNNKKVVSERNAGDDMRSQCKRNAPTPTPTLSKKVSKKEEVSKSRGVALRATLPPRGTRWASDAKVPDEWKKEALEKRSERGLAAVDLDLIADVFENYWSSLAGAKATKVDWRKTWINWALKENSRNGQTRRPSAHDNFFAGAFDVIREIEDRAAKEQYSDVDAVAIGGPLLPR